MLRKGALIVLVAALAGVAMLATAPAATATTEPAVTFFVLVPVNDARVVISMPCMPGPPPVPARLGGAFRRRQPRHQAVHGGHRGPSHAGASAGTEAAPQRLLRQSRAVPVQGRGQHPAQAERLASRHLVHGLPVLVFLGAVTVATAGSSGVAVTAPRDSGQSLGGTWASPNGSRASTRAATRAAITSRTVATLEPAWRFRFRGKGGGFGLLDLDAARRRRDRLRPGREVERVRARAKLRTVAMGAPLFGTERRAERCRGRGRSRRGGDGHHRLRPQPGERAEGVEPTPGRP